MALLTSAPVTVSVTSFPYSLPNSAGQVVFIGTNLPRDVRPPTHSVYNWEYACFFYYGGGAFIETYSVGGAWAVAGSGGHNVPPNLGALIFDFTDATWKRRDNANGVPWTTQNDYPDSTYSSGEFPGTQVPGPSHQYGVQAELRSTHGGGSRGSYLCLAFSAMGLGGRTGAGPHKIDLDTGLWTRAYNNNPRTFVGGQQMCFWEWVSNRYYTPQNFLGGSSVIGWLDGNDWLWKSTNHPGAPNFGGYTCAGFLDPVRRIIAIYDSTNRFLGIDMDNLGAGWTTMGVSGSAPIEFECSWVYYPPDGCFYHLFIKRTEQQHS